MKIIIYRHSISEKYLYSVFEGYGISRDSIIIIEGKNFSEIYDYDDLYEFTGYLEGINKLLVEDEKNPVLLMNDTALETVERLNINNIESTAKLIKNKSISIPIIHGILDNNINGLFNCSILIPAHKHIRTNLFMLNRVGMEFYQDIFSKIKKTDVINKMVEDTRLSCLIENFLTNDYHKKLHSMERKKVTIYLELLLTYLFYRDGIITYANSSFKNNIKNKIINNLKSIKIAI
jgi:hypothetical protein